jgi:hypothetical protein
MLFILPRTGVLGYFHAVPSGLLVRYPASLPMVLVNASGAVQMDRSKKRIWTSLDPLRPMTVQPDF